MKKQQFPFQKIVLVKWRDANARSGWGFKEEYMEHDVADVLTVGFLLKQTKDSITVITSQADWGDCNQALAIPIDWVTSVKVIGTADGYLKPKKGSSH